MALSDERIFIHAQLVLSISRVLRVHSWHRHMPRSAEVHMSDSHGLKGSGRDKAAVYFGFFLPGSLYV